MLTLPVAKWHKLNAASANKKERNERRRRDGESSPTPNATVVAGITTTNPPIIRPIIADDTTIVGTVISGPGRTHRRIIDVPMAGTTATNNTTIITIVAAVGTATTTIIIVGAMTMAITTTILAVEAIIMIAVEANVTIMPRGIMGAMVDTSTTLPSVRGLDHALLNALDHARERATGA